MNSQRIKILTDTNYTNLEEEVNKFLSVLEFRVENIQYSICSCGKYHMAVYSVCIIY